MPVNDVWKWDGKQQGQGSRYGIAKDWSQDAMWWYNTEVWAAAGLPPRAPDTPVSYDELLANAKAMTKTAHGKTSMYGLWYVSPNIDYIAGMVATAGGRIISEDLTTVDFSSPEARQALQWIVTAGKEGLGYSVVNPPADWDGPEMLAGKQAMANQGYWFTGYAATTNPAYETKLQFNAAPLLGSTRISPTYGAVGYWIPAKAANPGAAFAWLEWYCGGAGARQRIAAGDGPAVAALAAAPAAPANRLRQEVGRHPGERAELLQGGPGRIPLRAEHRDQHDAHERLPRRHQRQPVGRRPRGQAHDRRQRRPGGG